MSKIFRVALCVFTLYLTGCSAINVEKKYRSNSYDNRIQWIVLHYTSADFEDSLHLLTNTAVSSHYLISEQPVKVYQLVDESKRAWHAGDSSWHGRTWLNATSIGIELVHPGYTEQAGERIWHDWSTEQIDSLIVLLHDIL
ncbi:MAG: N-acetylmuramoyl-L-alanine amidase, partial [Gammaproteobacteria bacterium]|nr:N-acetylmuramoyl-L-alanine amidase [Gammaproteobacteria bacterium]